MKYFTIAQVVVSVGLIASILLQKQSAGAGGIFGGFAETYYSKRGFVKSLFYATIALAVLFLGLGVVNLVL